jgi:plastocyanin domain-containing protein
VVTVPWTIEVVAAEEPVRAVAVTGIKVSAAGFEPARLVIPANTRTQVAFTRADAQNCAREVVFPELGIRKELAVGRTVIVDIPPSKAGELHFACGMGMYRGVLVVQ